MPRFRPPRRMLIVAAALCYWLVLFYFTHRPITPGSSGPPLLPHADKLQHAVAFAALGILVCAAATCFLAPSWRLYVGVVVVIALYGALDEWSQGLVPRRTADGLDWAVDVCGATLGALLFAVIIRWGRPG